MTDEQRSLQIITIYTKRIYWLLLWLFVILPVAGAVLWVFGQAVTCGWIR
jgi:hypothetical protein